jgi:hypothetical protein
MRLALWVMPSFNRAFRRWTALPPPDIRSERLLSAPPRRSAMFLRARFLLEEGIAVRTADPVLPPDSAVG